jgi:hypothetical protein
MPVDDATDAASEGDGPWKVLKTKARAAGAMTKIAAVAMTSDKIDTILFPAGQGGHVAVPALNRAVIVSAAGALHLTQN